MKSQTAIDIQLTGIGRILFNHNVSVPIYQRSYAWQEEHISDLFDDIGTSIKEGSREYFVGSIVTTQNDSVRAEVADGQQRLATITILLAAIRDHFYEAEDRDRASSITSDLLHKKDLKTLALIPKLKLNDNDNEYFSKRILLLPDNPERDGSAPEKSSHQRINTAANIARKYVQGIAIGKGATDTLTDLVEYLTDSVKVIWVQVPDDTNAFMIFETLNDRGLALAITDLLKNHLFGLSGLRLGEVQRAWISMIAALETIDEENVLLTFLRHYWSSREGLKREKELYSDIKRKINSAVKAVSFAKELETNAYKYVAIANSSDALWSKYGDSCRKHMEALNGLRLIQIRPLLLSILDKFSPSETKLAVKYLNSWSVRFLIHGGLGSGQIESYNCAAAKEIRDGKIKTASQLFKRLQPVIPNDAQFLSSFADCNVSKSYLARYYLRALDQQSKGTSEPELVPNDNSDMITLEHILPQHPSKHWSHIAVDDQAVLVNRLGNLALLQKKINTKGGNDGFATKKTFYEKSEYIFTKTMSKETSWDRTAIDRRQQEMAHVALKVWPLK